MLHSMQVCFLKIIYFGYPGPSFLLCFSLVAVSWELLSSCGVWASRCHDFSSFRALALGHMGLISCSSWALEHRLNSCGSQA